METILVVDDSVINLKSIKRLLSETYKVVAVSSAADALLYLKSMIPDLILLDIMMPEMDGFDMVREMRKDERCADIPVIFITSDNDKEKELLGFQLGAMDFILKPFEPDVVLSRIAKTLELENLRHNLETEVKSKTREIENITLQSMMTVANMVDSKDRYSNGHSVNVAKLSEEIARRLGWTEENITNLHYMALLHDIGKIAIPDSIYNRPGRFTEEERELIKQHTLIGVEMLSGISIKNVYIGAKYHHERYDGKGYIEGLAGEDIPIEARIISAADAFDAMFNDRAYRAKLTIEQIVEEFKRERGAQFDPNIADIVLGMIEDGSAVRIISSENEGALDNGILGDSAVLLRKVISQYSTDSRNEADKDILTGLWNRDYASAQMNKLMSQSDTQGAVFMVDIDDFEEINSTYGHVLGDEMLARIAGVILEIVRNDDIACRVGGDKFFLYFSGIADSDKLKNIAARLIGAFNENVKYPDGSHGVSASIGIAVAPVDGTDFDKLYENSDKALYYAKNSGKSTYHFFGSGVTDSDTRDSINRDLECIGRMIRGEEPVDGIDTAQYGSLDKLVGFIRNNLGGACGNAACVLFTIHNRTDDIIPSEQQHDIMEIVEDSVRELLKDGDLAVRYSTKQILAILKDASESDAGALAERMHADFIKRPGTACVVVDYDILRQ